MTTQILFKKGLNLTGTLLAGFLALSTGAFSQELPKAFKSNDLYPEGRLEVGTYGFATKYLGEFTDSHIGEGIGLTTRYTLPFLPEISLGARYTHGYLRYDRRYQSRFGNSYLQQYPTEYFPDARNISTMRSTKIDSYEVLAYLNLFPHKELNYYLLAGAGILAFQPQDVLENPIQADGQRRDYANFNEGNQYNPHAVAGLGIDYYITSKISLGVQAAVHILTTDYVDGYAGTITDDKGSKSSNMDAYGDFGLKVSYNLFSNDDIDQDGLTNDEEKALGTNLYLRDSDEDGVPDFEEVRIYSSNPLIKDSDGDGLSDFDEAYKHHTTLALVDSDDDGLSDFDEVHIYHSNPLLKDSDSDGLADAGEILKGSNPLSGDSDGDGIADSQDTYPVIVGTPTNTSTLAQSTQVEEIQPDIQYTAAHDTVYVFREVKNIKASETFTPYGINFEPGKAKIREESEPILDDVVKWLQNSPGIIVEIRGHTDASGSEDANQLLSEARARAVKEYLVYQGVNPNRLETKGFGQYQPVADNAQSKGKARNRRIEFFVKSNEQQAFGEK